MATSDPPQEAVGLQNRQQEKCSARIICILSSSHRRRMLQGRDADWGCSGRGVPSAGLKAVGRVAEWAVAGCSSHERALHGTAQSRAVPNRGLVQLKGLARPWALPNQGLCQAAGPTGWSDMPNGEPCQVWAVPAWGPHWVMSCAKLRSMPESKPCQTPCCASPLCLGSQNHLSSQLPSASSPNLRVPATSVAPSLWGPSWKEP